MRRLAIVVLLAALGLVGWDAQRRGEWARHGAAAGLLAVAAGALAVPGLRHRRRRQRSPEVAATKVRIEMPEGPIELGKRVTVKLVVTAPRDVRLDHVLVHLVNRRFEKKAPLDRVVSQSTFIYRFAVDLSLSRGGEKSIDLPMRTLSCREPTRESKYVSISWELAPVLYFSNSTGEKAKYVYEGTPVPIQFTGPQSF
ncbi:MAG: hypothetical protein HY720_22195 [Planctomycetes bacterium]|nr:hypothetical protein [Planctomycetota bacterium]